MKINLKLYRCFVPKSIDLEEIAKTYPRFKGFTEDKCYYILSIINKVNGKSLESYNGYVTVNSSKMYEIGIRDFRAYIQYLYKAGIIYTDGSYVIGERSRSYKITDKYRKTDKVILINKKSLAKKINKAYATTMRDISNNLNLYKSFNENLTIEFNQALAYIDYKFETSEQTDNDVCSYNHNQRTIYAINDKNFRFSQDDKSGRIHTDITNMSKDVRQFLRYNGQRLINLDFKNSQPFLSTALFNEDFWTNNIENGYKGLGKNKLANFSNCNNCNDYINEDVANYIESVLSGTFYEDFMKITGIKDREEAKLQALSLFFSSDKKMSRSKRLFKKHYPTVFEKFRCIKEVEHSALAILLQSIESDLFIGRICTRIQLERPDLALFTIHDSILITKGAANYVKNIMIEETELMLGITPNISIE